MLTAATDRGVLREPTSVAVAIGTVSLVLEYTGCHQRMRRSQTAFLKVCPASCLLALFNSELFSSKNQREFLLGVIRRVLVEDRLLDR